MRVILLGLKGIENTPAGSIFFSTQILVFLEFSSHIHAHYLNITSCQPVLQPPALMAWPLSYVESRSDLLKKDTQVKRKVSGNSHEVISYLLLPQQATAGKNFLFPCSSDAHLPDAICLKWSHRDLLQEGHLTYRNSRQKEERVE